jgi:hypothetical protein
MFNNSFRWLRGRITVFKAKHEGNRIFVLVEADTVIIKQVKRENELLRSQFVGWVHGFLFVLV